MFKNDLTMIEHLLRLVLTHFGIKNHKLVDRHFSLCTFGGSP